MRPPRDRLATACDRRANRRQVLRRVSELESASRKSVADASLKSEAEMSGEMSQRKDLSTRVHLAVTDDDGYATIAERLQLVCRQVFATPPPPHTTPPPPHPHPAPPHPLADRLQPLTRQVFDELGVAPSYAAADDDFRALLASTKSVHLPSATGVLPSAKTSAHLPPATGQLHTADSPGSHAAADGGGARFHGDLTQLVLGPAAASVKSILSFMHADEQAVMMCLVRDHGVSEIEREIEASGTPDDKHCFRYVRYGAS